MASPTCWRPSEQNGIRGNGIAFSLLPGCHPEIEPSGTGSQKEQLPLKLSSDSGQEVTNTAHILEVLPRLLSFHSLSFLKLVFA